MYYGLNSLLCVAPWVSLPKGPYPLPLTRNDRSDFANVQADLSDCAIAQADLSLH